jgi:hypothetical protein
VAVVAVTEEQVVLEQTARLTLVAVAVADRIRRERFTPEELAVPESVLFDILFRSFDVW